MNITANDYLKGKLVSESWRAGVTILNKALFERNGVKHLYMLILQQTLDVCPNAGFDWLFPWDVWYPTVP